jgi:hypothetical protein
MSSSCLWLSWSGAFAGTGVWGTLSFEWTVAGSASGSIQNKRIRLLGWKSGFFLPQMKSAPENRLFSGATHQI